MRFLMYKKIICILIQMVVSEGCVCVSCSVLSDSTTPQTVAHQASLSMGFSHGQDSLSMGFSQARILEWIAIPISRGPS